MQTFNESLLTALDRADSEDVVFQALLAAARELGFEHVAYGLRLAVPVSNPKVITLNNYPTAWQERYHAAGYLAVDPSVRHGSLSQEPLLWTDEVFASSRQLWAEAKDQGLRHGWAQSSLDGFGIGGMLTLSRSGEALTACELRAKQTEMRWLVQAAHLSLSRLMKPKFAVHPDMPLTQREIEVLKWSADGKTAAEIGDIISISIPTVNFHIRNSIQKMKAANKTAAVVQALMAGLLN
jgi:DNA-binding CsgD family transcriptional regulator